MRQKSAKGTERQNGMKTTGGRSTSTLIRKAQPQKPHSSSPWCLEKEGEQATRRNHACPAQRHSHHRLPYQFSMFSLCQPEAATPLEKPKETFLHISKVISETFQCRAEKLVVHKEESYLLSRASSSTRIGMTQNKPMHHSKPQLLQEGNICHGLAQL